jgi:hypothetical protein
MLALDPKLKLARSAASVFPRWYIVTTTTLMGIGAVAVLREGAWPCIPPARSANRAAADRNR